MSSKIKRYVGAVIGTAIVCGGVLAGCGSTTNNDQGTSFLATGYFASVTGDTGLSGANVLIASDISSIAGVQGIIDIEHEDEIFSLAADGGQLTIFMGFQNRLATQFIRVVRIDCSYEVPGASIQIPNDSYNSSFVISAAGGGDNVVNGNVVEPAEAWVGFNVLSTDLFSYLNVNRASLPALPFRMTATCKGVGVTQAGDVLYTNDLVFPMTMVEESEGPNSSVGTIAAASAAAAAAAAEAAAAAAAATTTTTVL